MGDHSTTVSYAVLLVSESLLLLELNVAPHMLGLCSTTAPVPQAFMNSDSAQIQELKGPYLVTLVQGLVLWHSATIRIG